MVCTIEFPGSLEVSGPDYLDYSMTSSQSKLVNSARLRVLVTRIRVLRTVRTRTSGAAPPTSLADQNVPPVPPTFLTKF